MVQSIARLLIFFIPSFTRPDIALIVCHAGQFMSQPKSPHLISVKRIHCYLIDIVGFVIFFTIATYSYVDWTSCGDSWWSTLRFLFFLDHNLISWIAKKNSRLFSALVQRLSFNHLLMFVLNLRFYVGTSSVLIVTIFAGISLHIGAYTQEHTSGSISTF